MNTADKGALTEAIIIAALLKRCYVVLKPIAPHSRYDLVIEIEGSFKKIQCKTGRVINSAVEFNTNSLQWKTGRVAQGRNYWGEIDYFMVYCEATNGIYRVPVEDVGIHHARLRLQPTKNNQTANVLWAHNYAI